MFPNPHILMPNSHKLDKNVQYINVNNSLQNRIAEVQRIYGECSIWFVWVLAVLSLDNDV